MTTVNDLKDADQSELSPRPPHASLAILNRLTRPGMTHRISQSLILFALQAPLSVVSAQDVRTTDSHLSVSSALLNDSRSASVGVQQSPATAALDRVIALNLQNASLRDALATISAVAGVRFSFAVDEVERVRKTVSLTQAHITVRDALVAVLKSTGMRLVSLPGDQIGIVSDTSPPGTTAAKANGTIHGRVTDDLNQRPVRFAIVSLDGSRTTATNDSGVFRFADVAPGNHEVATRILGYAVARRNIPVGAGDDIEVALHVTKSVSELNQVVVTGSVVPTEVRAMPTPITVIDDSAIAQQQPHTIMELYRQYVPTGVSFDLPQAPTSTFMAGRGASDLVTGGSMKIIIDGIEVDSPGSSPIDPASIDRIEVIRGPEASAIYGSGAIDGVIQIFTKRGGGAKNLQVNLEAAAADVQTPLTFPPM